MMINELPPSLKKAIRVWMVVLCICGFPLIFNLLFGFGESNTHDWVAWIYLCIGVFYFYPLKGKPSSIAILFGVLLVLSIEFGFRASVKVFGTPKLIERMERIGELGISSESNYRGHPFFHYTGRPEHRIDHDRNYLGKFNHLGFVGETYKEAKPPGVVRILALGGSTTKSGYPEILEEILKRENKNKNIQVMNLGLDGYTSAHLLSLYALKFMHWNADFVLIHSGWNERDVRVVNSREFQTAYTNSFKSFAPPKTFDNFFIYASLIYRFFKTEIYKQEYWLSLEKATLRNTQKKLTNLKDLSQLIPFQRNILALITLAKSQNSRVCLVTIPYDRNYDEPKYDSDKVAFHISQTNQIFREIAKRDDQVDIIDLDKLYHREFAPFYQDLGHLNEEGVRLKAEKISKAFRGKL